MRTTLPFLLLLAPLILLSACSSSSGPSSGDVDGAAPLPTQDGAVCACATPDCLPNCSNLPPCMLFCENGADGGMALLEYIDPCGHIDFTQQCTASCAADASTPACQ
jgi:hypothetical protein